MIEPFKLTRRRLILASASIALLSPRLVARTQKQVPTTGKAVRGLESFDELMIDFLDEHGVPGAALAVSRKGRLVYARGFGHADVETRQPVEPDSLFRIASLSKPITAVAVMKLLRASKHDIDDRVLDVVKLEPHLEQGESVDPRWNQITLRQLLQHTGGWDREESFDPIARPKEIAESLQIPLPPMPEAIVRYMLGKPLDFDPGERYSYSNFGYLLLGRFIASVAKQDYEAYVRKSVLGPLGIVRPRLGKALLEDRQEGEVKYYGTAGLKGPALFGPHVGEDVPVQYGHDNLQAFEAHGGWIASAPDLVRFASDLCEPTTSKVLDADSIESMWEWPKGQAGFDAKGNPRSRYYNCGWEVVRVRNGRNAWHTGFIAGTSTLLVRRWDGLNWAVLFNADHSISVPKKLADVIDPLVHVAADKVTDWPEHDLFKKYL